MASLVGKVVVITGASSGIGAGTAKHFASLGSVLVLCGRNKDSLHDVGKACEGIGVPKDKILILDGDLTNEDYCKTIVDRTIAVFGALDVLVNNAGVGYRSSIENTPLESFDRVMNINVRAMFCLTTLAVPHLIKSKGSIVNVSSIGGIRSFPGLSVYAMSKAAVDQFTNCIALELAPKQVRVNSVNPGIIVTNFHKNYGVGNEEYTKILERSRGVNPLGCVGEVEDVAKAIAFLASDEASFITASQLPITGGLHAACPR